MIALKLAALYFALGALLALRTCPMGGQNFAVVTLLWPWPLAAHLVYKATGKYPRWTPWI